MTEPIDLDALRADADFDGYAARMSIGELDALIAELRASRELLAKRSDMLRQQEVELRGCRKVVVAAREFELDWDNGERLGALIDALADYEALK